MPIEPTKRRLSVRAASAVLALLAGAVTCSAQQDGPLAPPPPTIDSGGLLQGLLKPEGGDPKPVATDHEMLHKYVWSTLGLDGAISATLGSGLDQWKESPPEWSMDANGYARRWVSDYAETAIGDGAKYAVARIFHQDPSFYRCTCTSFGRRLHHAVAHRQVTDSGGHIVAARPCEQHGGKVDLAGLQLTEEPDDVEPVETRVDDQQIRSKPAGSKAFERLLRVPWRDRDVGSAARQCLLRGCWIADPDHVDMFRTSVRLLGHLRCRASFRSIEPIA